MVGLSVDRMDYSFMDDALDEHREDLDDDEKDDEDHHSPPPRPEDEMV